MNIIENAKMALGSIRTNKMRSFLTMLGIIIGISSVIMVLSAGQGGTKSITSQIEQIGATTFYISVNDDKATDSDYMTLDDASAIMSEVPNARYVSPVAQGYGSLDTGRRTIEAMVAAGSNYLVGIQGEEMVRGRFFSAEDYEMGRAVMTIDETAAVELFGTTDIVGMQLDMTLWGGRATMQIVGVTKNTDSFGFYGDEITAFIYVPYTLLIQQFDLDDSFGMLYVSADTKDNVNSVGVAVRNLIEARHGNRGRSVYSITNLMEQVDQINSILSIFTTFIAAVAAIALVVGGIGVMNIMLVSVTERTREIGIRKALGARTGTILSQFLTESAIITFLGGIIGLGFGMGGSYLICSFIGVDPVFTPSLIGGALLFSVLVGLFFGIYPARKAAKLNPIEALRHE